MGFITWKERSKMDLQIVTKEFKCDINPSIILGRRGENIKAIQSQTNTHITIIRENNNLIVTSYSMDNIIAAMELVNKLSENNNRMGNRIIE